MRVIKKICSVCECCHCSAAVRMVRMHAKFVDSMARQVHRHSNSVYASCCVFIMFKKIENPATCEMRSVIRFLNVKNMKPGEIHCQLCDVYGEHAMSSSMVRRWVRLFNEDAKMCMMICGAANRLVNQGLLPAVEEKIRENRRFTITSLSLHFLKFHGHFFTKLCQINLSFRNCVQTGWRRCLQKNIN